MNAKSLVVCIALAAVAAAGCSPSTGYIVKPIPINEEMSETVIQTDPGFFVTDKIAIVDVEGLLMNQAQTSLLSSRDNPVSEFIEKLDKAQGDPAVKAVILRINSPGGAVTAADIMYHRVMEFKHARAVPVIAIIEDVGASGGYYIACSAGTIMAHPTSITGSIGVIVQTFSLAGTLDKLGITADAVKSGKFKDMGSPLKALNADDRKLIQDTVDEFYKGFVKIVATGRGPRLSEDKVKVLADGRVYTGEQAKANGLIDDIGYMDDAIKLAKAQAHTSKAKVVMYHRPWGYSENAYSRQGNVAPQVNLVNINMPGLMSLSQPQFMYLWTGRN